MLKPYYSNKQELKRLLQYVTKDRKWASTSTSTKQNRITETRDKPEPVKPVTLLDGAELPTLTLTPVSAGERAVSGRQMTLRLTELGVWLAAVRFPQMQTEFSSYYILVSYFISVCMFVNSIWIWILSLRWSDILHTMISNVQHSVTLYPNL